MARDFVEKPCYIGVVTTQSSNRPANRGPASTQTETSSPVAPTFPSRESVCSSQVSPVKESAEFSTFFFQMKRDFDIRKNVYANVASSGGTTMFSRPGDHSLVSRHASPKKTSRD